MTYIKGRLIHFFPEFCEIYIICKYAHANLPFLLTEFILIKFVTLNLASYDCVMWPLVLFAGTSYSGYEAAVYSAASSYYQQQQQQQKQAAAAAAAAAATAAWTGTTFTKKAPFQNKQLKPKQPPKPPQIHYCDVCKISCAGPQVLSLGVLPLSLMVVADSSGWLIF